ncbi:MAG: hydroxyacid dehydrogenase [Candidatus Solibacter usitatus]|nr:hydroxyacid dehydrogenase [Candidatus Solibacter usitatus]
MIDIVLIGNIARCGREHLARHLGAAHRLRDFPCDLAEAQVLIGSPVTAEMIASAPKLRLIHSSGAGCETIAEAPGVPLCNVFHHERSMAEYIVMTMLALDRDLFRQDRNLRAGNWESSCVTGPPRASELAGRTLALVGYGHIGREAARLASAFDMRIASLRSGHARPEIEALLDAADFLVVACPLSAGTRGLIGAAELARLKPSASLINVARAEIVEEEALYLALRDRRIRSAAIDVWYQYPRKGAVRLPSRYPFHELDNVILTPHSSGWTERVVALRFRDIAANIDRMAAGEPLENCVR